MDLLKLALGSKTMRGIVAKIISKAIVSKTGKEAEIYINDFSIKNDEKHVTAHINLDADMTSEDFYELLEKFLA